MTHYDLVIIGTGSGNSLVTSDFDGKRVALIENGVRFGGTCLNVGCIPTKMFVYASEVAHTIQTASTYGIDATLDSVRWRDIRDRVFGRIDPISDGGKDYRQRGSEAGNTTLYLGTATFTGPKTLSVDIDGTTHEVTGDDVVIATGSHAVIPSAIADAGVPYLTSDTVMRIDDLPESMIVLGAGVIAAEFAHVFSQLGVKITVIARGQRLLRQEDEEISEAFTQVAQDKWDVRLRRTVSAAEQVEDRVRLTLDDGSVAEGEALLVATGRAPSTDKLNLTEAGVETHDDGRIRTDPHGRTTAAGVWSLGDATNDLQLKHVANHEARVVAHNLAHPDDLEKFNYTAVPRGIFTHPQIAAVGLTEDQARAKGHDVTVKTQKFGDVAYGWAMEDTTGLCKVVADRTNGQILGATLMCPDATALIQPVIQAMSFGLSAQDMARGQYWIHPAMTEVLENALLGLDLP